MPGKFEIFFLFVLAGCSADHTELCEGQILDLTIENVNNPSNKLLKYFQDNADSFVEIIDTNQLLRYEEFNRITHFFQRSRLDSTKRRYTYKAKDGIIKTDYYQWDLLAQVDNDKKGPNITYWLKSYDNERRQVGHLDFAHWSADGKSFHSGRIDCDSTLHMIIQGREHRIFKTDPHGKNELTETIGK